MVKFSYKIHSVNNYGVYGPKSAIRQGIKQFNFKLSVFGQTNSMEKALKGVLLHLFSWWKRCTFSM